MAYVIHNRVGGRGGSSKRRGGSQPALMSEINVTPFVDVMLVLLIIFMVTAPLLVAGVQVDLPKAEAAPVAGQDEPVSVTIKKDGSIYLQESKVELDALAPKMGALKKETRIFVRGDQSIDYGRVMQVVSVINGAGFNKVALITEVPGK